MAQNFFRTFVDDASFIRGAARILIAPITWPMPAKIADVIALGATTGNNDVQTLTASGTPTSGNFKLTLDVSTSANLGFAATAAQIQTALVAMPSIGAAGVTCTGGPIGTAPVVCTFVGPNAKTFMDPMTVDNSALVGGSVANAHTTPGSPDLVLYDAMPGWSDLGATKNGIQITVNNAEETFDIDQQLGIIGSAPTSWTVGVGTSLAEVTPERLQVAWQGSGITIDNTPTVPEKEIGIGSPNFYIQRRLAVLFQRPSGLIRAFFFRIVQRTPAESSLAFNKTGDQQSIPVQFNCLPDNSITDVLKQFFIIRDQAVTD